MKKFYMYFIFIFLCASFTFINATVVHAEDTCVGVNLTGSLEGVPQLCINANMGYNVNGSYWSYIDYKQNVEDYKYIIVKNNDTTNIYSYYAYILADYSKYSTTKYETHFQFYSDATYKNAVYIQSDLTAFGFGGLSASFCNGWGMSYGSTLASAQADTTQCKNGMAIPSGYGFQYSMIYRLKYNNTTSLWETDSVNYRPEQIYTYNNGTSPNILYSSWDIYTSINSDVIYKPNTVNTLPDYLDGYKKVTLTADDKYAFLSHISSGSVYVPKLDYLNYDATLSYYDKELTTQTYASVIQNATLTEDSLFYKIDFNLLDFDGAEYMLFSKYAYLEGDVSNITYDIYVPDATYVSLTKPTPVGNYGNTFPYKYMDEAGNVIDETATSYSYGESILPFFTNFNSNTFGLSSIITAPLTFIQSILTSNYTSLTLPIPLLGGNIILPNMTTVYQTNFSDMLTLYQLITDGLVSYFIIVSIFKLVKDFKDPNSDRIEVVDL